MVCFADINVSQSSVATYARCGWIFNMHLTTNLQMNLPVKLFLNRLTSDRIMVMSLWPRFFGPPCTFKVQNKAAVDRRFRPRCCHLGSYLKHPKSSPVRQLACNWYYCAQLIAKPKAACALRFSWAATSSNLGL